MRVLFLIPFLLLITACMPNGPTGNIAVPVTQLDDPTILITADVMEKRFDDAPVRITVHGDIVYKTLKIDGEPFTLSGTSLTDEWLSQKGTLVTWLSPGKHEIRGHSCFDTFSGYECGCINEDDCGYWMVRWVTVP